jgi:hypothetical protein
MKLKNLLQSPAFVIYAFLVGAAAQHRLLAPRGRGVTLGQGTPFNRAMRRQMGAVVNTKSTSSPTSMRRPRC